MATLEINGSTKLQQIWGYFKQLPDRGRLSDIDLKRFVAQIVTAVHMSAEVDETGAADDAELTRRIAAACVAKLQTLELSTMAGVLQTVEWAKDVMGKGLHVNFWQRFDMLGMHPTLSEAFKLRRPAVVDPPVPPGLVITLSLGVWPPLYTHHVFALDGRSQFQLAPDVGMDDPLAVICDYDLPQGSYLVVRTGVGAEVDQVVLVTVHGPKLLQLTFQVGPDPLRKVIDLIGQKVDIPAPVRERLAEFDREPARRPSWAR